MPPKLLLTLALAGLLITAVLWIESGAKARLEAGRLAQAVQAQNRSLADVRERSQAAHQAHAGELAAAQTRIEALKAEAAAVPDAPPIDQFCRPGCKPRWN